MTAPEQRVPKQDRSRITRERLLGASIDLLATQGWAATTVGAVAAAAGVSRGAAQHHFPTREDLFTAAVEYVAEERSLALRALFPDGAATGPEVVEHPHHLLEGIVVERTIRPYTPVLGSQAPTFAEHLER